METWVPNVFDSTIARVSENLLRAATEYPQAFRILPCGEEDPGAGWAKYHFDGTVNLWVDTSHPEAIEMYRDEFNQRKEIEMSKALTVKEKDSVRGLLASNIKAIQSVLPRHLTPERMLRIAYTTIVLNPNLARCTQISLVNGVIGASVLGLEIGGPLGLAHLVPFKNSRTKSYEATLIVDYKGLIELFYKSPVVKSVSAQPVYVNDAFSYRFGTSPHIDHAKAQGERGDLIYAYCIVFFTGGGYEMEVIDRQDAMAAKAHSKGASSPDSPWNKKADEWTMWVKTAVRRISKRIPKSPELQRALSVDSATDTDGDDTFRSVIAADFDTVTNDDNPQIEEKPPKEKPEEASPKGRKRSEPAANGEETAGNPDWTEEEAKTMRQYETLARAFPEQTQQAMDSLGFSAVTPSKAIDMMSKIDEIIALEDQA